MKKTWSCDLTMVDHDHGRPRSWSTVVCHLLRFHLSKELSADDTIIQDGTNTSLISDDSQAHCSNGSLGEVAPLMFHLLVSALLGV